MPRLDTLFLDAAGTLIHPDPGVGALYAQAARARGIEVEARALDAAFGPAWKAARASAAPGMPPYGRTRADAVAFWRPVVEQCFAAAGAAMPADPFFDEVFDAFATPRAWRMAADAGEAVAIARDAGARVVVLSNFDVRLNALADAFGWRDLFDAVLVSADLGVEKPDPRIYALAGRGAGRAGMVGDSPVEDHDGPVAAGWSAVLLRPGGSPDPGGRPAAASLADAVRMLLA